MLLAGESLPKPPTAPSCTSRNDTTRRKEERKRGKTWSAQSKQHDVHQANAPNTTVHALLVIDTPRIRRPSSDDFLSVARFARGREVLSAPFGLQIECPVGAGALKDPLLECQRSWCKRRSKRLDDGRRCVPIDWVHCGTHSR